MLRSTFLAHGFHRHDVDVRRGPSRGHGADTCGFTEDKVRVSLTWNSSQMAKENECRFKRAKIRCHFAVVVSGLASERSSRSVREIKERCDPSVEEPSGRVGQFGADPMLLEDNKDEIVDGEEGGSTEVEESQGRSGWASTESANSPCPRKWTISIRTPPFEKNCLRHRLDIRIVLFMLLMIMSFVRGTESALTGRPEWVRACCQLSRDVPPFNRFDQAYPA